MSLRVKREGGVPLSLREKESTWDPKTDLKIWEITHIFELLRSQDFFLKRLLQIKGETTFTQTLAGFDS